MPAPSPHSSLKRHSTSEHPVLSWPQWPAWLHPKGHSCAWLPASSGGSSRGPVAAAGWTAPWHGAPAAFIVMKIATVAPSRLKNSKVQPACLVAPCRYTLAQPAPFGRRPPTVTVQEALAGFRNRGPRRDSGPAWRCLRLLPPKLASVFRSSLFALHPRRHQRSFNCLRHINGRVF